MGQSQGTLTKPKYNMVLIRQKDVLVFHFDAKLAAALSVYSNKSIDNSVTSDKFNS